MRRWRLAAGPPSEDGPLEDRVQSSTAAGADAFWLQHLRSGFLLYTVGTLLAAAYLALTPDGPHRGIEWAMVVVALVATSAVVAVPARTIVQSPHRVALFVGWSAFTAVFVSVVAGVDGGLRSPLALLLYTPITYASLAYPVRAVVAIGGLAAIAATGVALVEGDTLARTLMFTGTIAMVTLLCATVTRARSEQEAARARLTQQLVELATRDGLTGCLNHRAFYERLEAELKRSVRHGHHLSVLLVDVDDFKSINDTMGHLVGDDVLSGVGSALRATSRASDVVGRIGGDEFAVMVVESDRVQAEAAASRLEAAVAALDGSAAPTVTIGIAHLDPTEGVDASARQLMGAADADLYQRRRSEPDAAD